MRVMVNVIVYMHANCNVRKTLEYSLSVFIQTAMRKKVTNCNYYVRTMYRVMVKVVVHVHNASC